jgi:hypothetical protein
VRRRTRLVELAALLALILACPAKALSQAPGCLPANVDGSLQFRYVLTLASSLEWAKQSIDRTKGADLTSPAGVTDFMLSLKLAQRDLECAASLLEPFIGVQERAIKTSAEGARSVFRAAIATNGEIVVLLRDALDGKLAGVGTFGERLASIGLRADEAWKLLPVATIAATYALIETTDADPTPKLNVTEAERRAVMAKLQETFDPGVRLGAKAGQIPLEFAAAALYQFVANPRWASRVER